MVGNLLGQEDLTCKMELLEKLLENIAGGVEACQYSDGFPIRYVNGGFTKLTGYTLEELNTLLGGQHLALVHPKDREMVKQLIHSQLRDSGCYDLEYRILHRDGRVIWVLNKGTIISEEGKGLIQGVLTDITRHKQLEQELRISEKRYELAMNFSDVTIFDYNIQTKQMHLHPWDVMEYNLTPVMENAVETLINRGVIQPRSHRTMCRLYRRIEQGAPSASAIVFAKSESGEEQVLELILATIYDDEGNPVSAVGVRRNITETLRMKRELEYGSSLVTGKSFAYEANITTDSLMGSTSEWLHRLGDLSPHISFSGMVRALCREMVAPEQAGMVAEQLSTEEIENAYGRGERLVELQYRQRTSSCGYEWCEQTLNIIKDQMTGDIVVRSYLANIDQKKHRELQAENEQQFYKTMVARSMVTYEMNLTRNQLLSGNEKLAPLGIPVNGTYSNTIRAFAAMAVHPDERDGFLECFCLENILEGYRIGRADTRYEYRRRGEDGAYIWVRSLVHLFEDTASGDVKGFLYVEQIDEQKRAQLELLYKSQHDQLTGLYNKATMAERTDELLRRDTGRTVLHAYLLIDLDCFKEVNDTFGHVFGDAVLSRFAAKIHGLFRQEDLVGRIGGDEFAALMCDVRSHQEALDKAQEICDQVVECCSKETGEPFRLSTSVGVAFYREDGATSDELYLHSDTALYAAKRSGKNCVVAYGAD